MGGPFPNDVKALERQRSRYRPQSIEEERMHSISQRMLKRIQQQIKHYQGIFNMDQALRFCAEKETCNDQ